VAVALDERDSITREHCDRVSGLAIELGLRCGLTERELDQLRIAAGFHDVGKIGIPDSVLKKKTPLNDDDWAVMKSHSAKSERIILAAELEDGAEIAAAARHHHERFDGGGYPDGLSGEAIPSLARIIAIADTYDAMAKMRLYAAKLKTHAEIMTELHSCAGQQHDPYLIQRFAEIVEWSRYRVD
jgi:HD-GYP domain-containing protein (c-di-GMP phosphodiesterase class II)